MVEALQFEFMQNALLAGLLASLICGIMGTMVVVNRIVFLSGGIAHAAFGGIGLAIVKIQSSREVHYGLNKQPSEAKPQRKCEHAFSLFRFGPEGDPKERGFHGWSDAEKGKKKKKGVTT